MIILHSTDLLYNFKSIHINSLRSIWKWMINDIQDKNFKIFLFQVNLPGLNTGFFLIDIGSLTPINCMGID